MRAVIQRIATKASVTGKQPDLFGSNTSVDAQVVSSIGHGLCVLVGVGTGLVILFCPYCRGYNERCRGACQEDSQVACIRR